MELGPEDVSLLERCPHVSGCYVQASDASIFMYIYYSSYKGGQEWSEYGDCSIIHMLTGWCPQSLPTR